LLFPADWGVFRDATQRLQQDDSHTVEVSFRLQVEPEDDREIPSGTLYQQMEGKGMFMIDCEDGQPSHTMWVVKPMASPPFEYPSSSIMLESGEVSDEPASAEATSKSFADRSGLEPVTPFPFSLPISTELLLCRICESQIPQWYFEKHSETCVEVHRHEAEIAECNDSISELRNTIRELCASVDKASSAMIPEYRGMPIISPASSPRSSSPLQLFRVNKLQQMGAKKMQRRLLEQLEDILLVASEVSMPSLREEEAKEPIERQRLLSPSSERKMSQVRNWSKPSTQDAALTQLVEDAERVMRQKIDNVVRMQNTIRYSEKIWHEWEERVEQELDREDGEEQSGESSDEDRPIEQYPEDDRSSINSGYVVTGDAPSSEPTPMASSSPSIVPSKSRSSVLLPLTASDPSFLVSSPNPISASLSPSPPPLPPLPTAPTPALWQALGKMPTRSSTPSSISSPLALAAPIVASAPEDVPPPMNLSDLPSTGNLTIKTQRSAGNLLDPRIQITPPASPMLSPQDGVPTRRGHRRHSTAANVILSPTTAASGAPMSPRQSSAAPVSRTSPTSIKDFEVIKPISKGAFGSVFLAKKKVTGDYYAIKVLKKADMIAKNQITNVKAERMILMKQAESPFVAKLYFTFQSKENLYLVMEYLNGGDCAALIKSLGSLPEEWAKNYIAEVVLGLDYLHQRGVVHRYDIPTLVGAGQLLTAFGFIVTSSPTTYSSTSTVILN
jgi:serine/threonine-protein kinase RIM15